MITRVLSITGLVVACCFAIGCDQTPSNEENKKDERGTRQASPTNLDESAIRRIIKLEGANPREDSGHEGEFLRINGVVSGIEIEVAEGDSKTLVKVTLLDDPTYSADCYFTNESRTTIQQLQLGEMFRASGKCRYISDSLIELSGCVID